MAFSISFSGISKKDGLELFVIEPAWWEISKLEQKVKYLWIESNDGSYSDRDADISIDEARILHKQFKSRLVKDIAYNTECIESERKQKGTRAFSAARLKDYVKHVSKLQSYLTTLDSAVGESAENFSHFHVRVFEWDSGL